MKQQKKERESNLKIWAMTAATLFGVLGIFALARIPKNNELNDIKAEIQTVNKEIAAAKTNQMKNSAYQQKFDVVKAEKDARDRFLKVVPEIYTERKLSNQAKEFARWEKFLPGKQGKSFIKDYGDSYGYLKNKSTAVYFGNLTNVNHTKITVVDVTVSQNKKDVTYAWQFDYDLKLQKINSFKEIAINNQ
ncbi:MULTISPECIES: hypothetical protein [Lactobacillus]|uniref:Uncharacterized protein n=1 Tax=Lactobacillus xujianguonis TaxID=2495899 RepID=A0A437SWC7_9LACO|nr:MULTISPECIES: hypothetical protein [Lactobacillus]RVU71226.1 hypothetical protein EJK17_03245 [Lactobacillus xujianguonis]